MNSFLKTLVIFIITFFSSQYIKAQNLQLHYDFGAERQFVTSTFEYGKFTEKGNTFMFIDFDYGRTDGTSLGYWEILHEFKINSVFEGFNIHVEYNDGLVIKRDDQSPTLGFPIHRAYLLGVGMPINIGDFTLNTAVSAKYFEAMPDVEAQVTISWFYKFWDNKITFSGFADLWSQDLYYNGTKYGVFLSEPQLWYNINPTFSVGSEVEMSKNFLLSDNGAFMVRPTIAVKWNM